jgi:hypothetical protein
MRTVCETSTPVFPFSNYVNVKKLLVAAAFINDVTDCNWNNNSTDVN